MKIKLKDKEFMYRFAIEDDLDTINQFDRNIYKQVDHKFYFRHTKKMLKNMISKDKKILVVFNNDKLVAWGGLFSKVNEKYAKIYNLTTKEVNESGVIVAAAVSKRYRGYGLQRFLMKKRIDYLKKLKKKYVLNSIHPQNLYSIINTLNMGFKFKIKSKSINRNVNLNYYILKL